MLFCYELFNLSQYFFECNKNEVILLICKIVISQRYFLKTFKEKNNKENMNIDDFVLLIRFDRSKRP